MSPRTKKQRSNFIFHVALSGLRAVLGSFFLTIRLFLSRRDKMIIAQRFSAGLGIARKKSPGGTIEQQIYPCKMQVFSRPSGTLFVLNRYPALKRWAIIILSLRDEKTNKGQCVGEKLSRMPLMCHLPGFDCVDGTEQHHNVQSQVVANPEKQHDFHNNEEG